jgi:lactate dehydrogenase-like 2-hydroxyacid dehydrogenase
MPKKPKLLALNRFPDAVEARIARDYDARSNADDRKLSSDEIAALSQGMDGVLTSPASPLTAESTATLAPSVRIVATFSVGTDHIDLAAARKRGLVVTNTPDVLTDATADIAMLLLLAAARRAYEGQAMLRAGRWTGWVPTQLMGLGFAGKRLGLVGMGRIGQALVRRARPFGLEIHYHNRRRLPPDQEEGAIFHADLEEMLPLCHFLSLHCPLTPETRKLLNAQRIAKLPDGAVVVNTARGPVVDDDALIAALASGKLAAAGLDVFDGEPKVHPGYLTLDNAYLLPHLGSATVETRNAMGFRALDNLDAFFAGREPPDRVA